MEAVDAREECGFWASAGECEKNPGYMLINCKHACGNSSAQFVVGKTDEYITIDEDWNVERTGPAKRSRDQAIVYWKACSTADEVCPDAATCVRETAERDFLAPRIHELALEKALFENAIKIAPNEDPETTTPTDLDVMWRAYWDAKNVTDLHQCIDEATCLQVIEDVGLKYFTGTDRLREATRARSNGVRNKTCADATTTLFASEAVQTQDKFSVELEDGSFVEAQDLFYQPSYLPQARITHIHSFIPPEDCTAMMDYARPRLRRATHAKDGDLSAVSNTRDAQQATVSPRTLSEAQRVQKRAIDLANALSNYTLAVDGQEDLMAIQYFQGQQYMLHCDGSCDGTPHLSGGRIATVLMFCQDAIDGGATVFPNAGVHVKPRAGDAVYFHFRGPESTGLTEHWHTEHSGCPVRDGEKWVLTLWLRDGVSKDRPHHSFSPFGGSL